jgi:ubiquinone/menaquinone biosynthesis C-methylase UbiE
MPLSREEWHQRFLIQAQWSKALRFYIYDQIVKNGPLSVLDAGCGTGSLLPELETISPGLIFGLDKDFGHLGMAAQNSPPSSLTAGDVHNLPYMTSSIDIVVCHYFLMWVGSPEHAISEMHRVTRPGGSIIAFAEPDYGGRIDHPPEFIRIRDYQISSLLNAGADPRMGRKLKSLFASENFSDIEYGILQGSWQGGISQEEFESEWRILNEDLAGFLTKLELDALKKHDQKARKKGTRLVYVPTFYASGKVVK